ncbi:unnamed protein product [Cyclocybe aegerita]|uniref:Uncharacterized protein n=1 Tax=Cyclocybe aegerita TaxID=1973307 RepID=A0A8S0VZJ1_CYCAE|nr:unnamed protein product [Cyclocybe aegerita]
MKRHYRNRTTTSSSPSSSLAFSIHPSGSYSNPISSNAVRSPIPTSTHPTFPPPLHEGLLDERRPGSTPLPSFKPPRSSLRRAPTITLSFPTSPSVPAHSDLRSLSTDNPSPRGKVKDSHSPALSAFSGPGTPDSRSSPPSRGISSTRSPSVSPSVLPDEVKWWPIPEAALQPVDSILEERG